jgi:hypothetical protein
MVLRDSKGELRVPHGPKVSDSFSSLGWRGPEIHHRHRHREIISLSHIMYYPRPTFFCPKISTSDSRSRNNIFEDQLEYILLVPGRSSFVRMRYQTIRWTDFYKQHKDPPTRRHDTEVASSLSRIYSTASTTNSLKAVDSNSMTSQWLLPTKRRSSSSMDQT